MNESEVRFLRSSGDIDFHDHARRQDRVLSSEKRLDFGLSFEREEAVLLIGIGIAVGMLLMWALLGVVFQP